MYATKGWQAMWQASHALYHREHCPGTLVEVRTYTPDRFEPMLRRSYTREVPCPECEVELPFTDADIIAWRNRWRYKAPTAFSHSHDTRVAPKASARLPYAHHGWDVNVTLEHGTKARRVRNSERSVWGNTDKRDYMRPVMGEREHIAEELAWAREVADMEAIERHDDWLLDLDYEDQRGRDFLAAEAEMDAMQAHWADEDDAREEARALEEAELVALMEAPISHEPTGWASAMYAS